MTPGAWHAPRAAGRPSADMPDPADSLRYACLRGPEGLHQIADELETLVDRLAAARERPWYYARPFWLQAWAKHCCEQVEIVVWTARDADGALVGVLPLGLQQVRIGRLSPRALTVLGWPVTDCFEVPAATPEACQGLLRHAWDQARKEVPGWHCWMLREIADDGPTMDAVRALQGARKLPQGEVFPAGLTPVLDLEEFARDGDPRKKSERYRITKFRRKLDKKGEMESVFWRVQPDESERIWQNAVAIEARSWKAESGEATALQGGAGTDMLREVWETAVARGELACAEVRLDGQPLASHWGFCDAERFLSFHMAYDNDYRKFGLGSVMLDDMVEQAPDLGLRWIDASRGNPQGTHILGNYGGIVRKQVQLVLPRPSLAGAWFKLKITARRIRDERAAARAAAEQAAAKQQAAAEQADKKEAAQASA